ncbi:hypothetical protein KKB99_04365, partial [bacterium]|nr:hypothetical protein [bacterium]MBU1025228.1 hypothetical protein [bacterium]
EIENQLKQIETLKKKIKEEKRSREAAEYNLRKTNAKVAEIQTKFSSRPVTMKIARDAKKAGRKTDEIKRSREDIDKYETALKESQLAKAGVNDNSSDEDDTTDVTGFEDEYSNVISPEEKKKDSGLDLDF